MKNKMHLWIIISLVLLFSANVFAENVNAVTLSQAYPNNQESNYNPRLSVLIQDSVNLSLTVIFETNNMEFGRK
jgi:hypothetical protein